MTTTAEILLVPFPHSGHLFPFAELCSKLALKDLKITILYPSYSDPPSSLRRHPLIQIRRYPLAHTPRFDPNPLESLLSRHVSDYIDGHDRSTTIPRAAVAVVDDLLPWLIDSLSSRGVPTVAFSTSSASSCALDHAVADLPRGEILAVEGLPDMGVTSSVRLALEPGSVGVVALKSNTKVIQYGAFFFSPTWERRSHSPFHILVYPFYGGYPLQTGSLIQTRPKPQVDMYSHWEELPSLGTLPGRHVFPNSKSTMEAEFIALDLTSEEADWLRNLVTDIPLWSKPVPAIPVHCDSQAAIAKAQRTTYNGKSRHIRLRYNRVKQLRSSGVIAIDFVRSKNNLADPLTKGLSRRLVLETARGMGLKPID